MAIYLKKFENHIQYDTYINGSSAILPNVSICTTEGDVHYKPYVEPPNIVAKFNVTDTSNPTKIGYNGYISGFSAIEIDGVEQPSVVSAYTFSTTGEHTVKYTLVDPTSIGSYAFYGCTSLTSCTIGSGVTRIGGYAFYSCTSLTSIGSIGSGASVEIPSSVRRIDGAAFQNCRGITNVTIGSGVTSIGIYAFYGCYSLTSITSNAVTAPTIASSTFQDIKTGGTLYVSQGSSGYDVWMNRNNYYLGRYGWTKVEQ